MEIILIRHGETNGNVARRHQAEKTQLSFVGERQVKEAAERIKKYKPTHLVASNLLRAVETARIIGEECDLVPETSSRFIEIMRPDYLYGRHHGSVQSIWFYFLWYLGRDTQVTNGGESYKALRERFKLAKADLAQYPDDARVVVVSHAVFINLFIAHLCRDKALSPLRAALVFIKVLRIPNGHMIKVRFDKESKPGKCAWSVDS